MYRCQLCNSVVPAETPQIRVVTETRPKNYPVYRPVKGSKGRNQETERVGSAEGNEIVKEVSVCVRCAADLKAREAEAAPVVVEATL